MLRGRGEGIPVKDSLALTFKVKGVKPETEPKNVMMLYEYGDGKIIRELTDKEEIYYNKLTNNGACDGGVGTVDGNLFGYLGIVYAE